MSELRDFACGLPEFERALVLAPHPDDESLGLGGTIALYSDKAHFTVVAVSNGEAVNIPEDGRGELRKKELEAAIKTLGARELLYLDIPDGKFSEHRNSIRSKLSDLFSGLMPEIVFVPSPVDLHPDHGETALACMEVSRRFPFIKLAFYEIYNPIRFNVLVDIGPVIETKKRALMHYHYGMLKKEEIFIASNLGLNRSRSLFTLQDSYYEAFWLPPAPPTLTDAVTWFSNDLHVPAPEDRLFDNLRFADALLHEVRMIEQKSGEKDKAIEKLAFDLKQRDESIAVLANHLHQLETGLFQKLAKKYYRLRNALFPEGTSRKRLYEKAVRSFKDRLH